MALDDALHALAAVHPRKSDVVELRYFGGLSLEETAEALHVSIDTVKRDWRFAKLWFLREIGGVVTAPAPDCSATIRAFGRTWSRHSCRAFANRISRISRFPREFAPINRYQCQSSRCDETWIGRRARSPAGPIDERR